MEKSRIYNLNNQLTLPVMVPNNSKCHLMECREQSTESLLRHAELESNKRKHQTMPNSIK